MGTLMPFVVDRQGPDSLTEQVVVGIKRSIEHGHFQAGASLPTLKETAADLGVSLEVARGAIRRLAQEGVVTARPKCGIHVCDSNHQRWKGHVLYLHWGGADSYYEAVSSETLQQQLLAREILVTPVQLSGPEMRARCPRVKSVIHAGPIDLAIVSGGAYGIGVFLAENEIPFVHLAGPDLSSPSGLARRILVQDARPVLEQAVQHAVACGVRSLMIVAHQSGGEPMRGIAEAAGLSVRLLFAKPIEGMGSPEAVERGGLETMARWLDGGESLPDLIYFADDYVARGGLTELLARGIRIPEDVQVISWANRHLGPVFRKPLTRIEMDPVRDGQAMVELVMETLKQPGKKVKEPVVIRPEFVEGGTTRSVGG